MKAVEELRAAGATVVIDDSILPDDFIVTAARISTRQYTREGTEQFPRALMAPRNIIRRTK